MSQRALINRQRRTALASLASALLLFSDFGQAQQAPSPGPRPAPAADQIANFFGTIGDQIYEECIFELSQEQIDVQQALVHAYIQKGASALVARQLAVKQIQPPKLSENCERMRRGPNAAAPGWATTTTPEKKPAVEPKGKPAIEAKAKPTHEPPQAQAASLAKKKVLAQWDCAPGVDYVTIKHNGYERKLTDGEICNPFEDVLREVPSSLKTFRLGYTTKTGRLFVITDAARFNGQTIAWALSGRDVCRNNPDPECFAARAVGPLPPGEYSFAAAKEQRINFGPKTKRNVAAVYLTKLSNREKFTPQQTAAILARGNIAIHMRLKGEMSEACIGLEPKGWAHVASLIKDMRATALTVYIDEPYPQIAGNPPVIVASSFSFSSLFK